MIWAYVAVFVLGAFFGSMIKAWFCFRDGFKQGYHQGCMTAKKIVRLFEDERGDPCAEFHEGYKTINAVAHIPPQGRQS